MKHFIIASLIFTAFLAVFYAGQYLAIPSEKQQELELINFKQQLEI